MVIDVCCEELLLVNYLFWYILCFLLIGYIVVLILLGVMVELFCDNFVCFWVGIVMCGEVDFVCGY